MNCHTMISCSSAKGVQQSLAIYVVLHQALPVMHALHQQVGNTG
jgi:hypothetical protein